MRKQSQDKASSPSSANQVILLLFLCCFVAMYVYCHYFTLWENPRIPPEEAPAIVAEIEGEVPNPGIYFFTHVPTVMEVLAASGKIMNFSPLIYPKPDLALPSGTSLRVMDTQDGVKIDRFPLSAGKRILLGIPLNLNTAKGNDLLNIPGIGPKLSRAIVTYRDNHGGFSSLNEIKKVKGIGEKKFRKIRKYLLLAENIT